MPGCAPALHIVPPLRIHLPPAGPSVTPVPPSAARAELQGQLCLCLAGVLGREAGEQSLHPHQVLAAWYNSMLRFHGEGLSEARLAEE